MVEHSFDIDYEYMDWRFFSSLQKHNKFEIIRPIISQQFQEYYLNGRWLDSYEDVVWPMFHVVYKNTLSDDDYRLLKSMLLKILVYRLLLSFPGQYETTPLANQTIIFWI